MMDKHAKVYVAGGQTLIGAAILRQLQRQGYMNIVGLPPFDPDLAKLEQVNRFFVETSPDYVFVAAGRSGGILANQKYSADIMLDNLRVIIHVIDTAYRHGVQKLLYLASSCSYPKYAPQPMPIEALLTGPLEPTNKTYAIAKIAGIELCQAYRQQYDANFIAAIPANEFGPGDNFYLEEAHVIAGLLHRMHKAKVVGDPRVEIWGSGAPRREFIFVDDLANACLLLMNEYNASVPINVGSGTDITIRELALLIKDIAGYGGELYFNTDRPDGMPLKILDSSVLQALGWQAQTSLLQAVQATYDWFLHTEYAQEIAVDV